MRENEGVALVGEGREEGVGPPTLACQALVGKGRGEGVGPSALACQVRPSGPAHFRPACLSLSGSPILTLVDLPDKPI